MKKIVWIVVVVALAVGLYFFISFEKKLFKGLIVLNQEILLMDKFLTTSFPDQVKSFQEALRNQQTTPLPASTTPTPKK